jgi:putative FmdB family regulatory protein
MPVYEFKCQDCGHLFSELRKIGDFHTGTCEKCGSESVAKLISGFSSAVQGTSCAPSGGG